MQPQAVQNGGMSLLAGHLGCVRLAQPVRFRAAWGQAATLWLRDGDLIVCPCNDRKAEAGEPGRTPLPLSFRGYDA